MSMSWHLRRRVSAVLAALVVLIVGQVAWAVPPPASDSLPELAAPPALGALAGRPVSRIEIVTLGGRWQRPLTLRRARLGDPLSGELARRAMQELADSGYYAEIRAEAIADAAGVVLKLIVLPRRIIQTVRVSGGVL